MAKYRAILDLKHINHALVSRKKKENRKKAAKRNTNQNHEATELEKKKRACIIFLSLGGNLVANDYSSAIHGIPQLYHVEEETLSNPVCVIYLHANRFIGKAEDLVHSFCY